MFNIDKILYFLFFVGILVSSRCWIGFHIKEAFDYFFFIIMFFIWQSGRVKFIFKNKYLIFALLVLFAQCYFRRGLTNPFQIVKILVYSIDVLFVISIEFEKKKEVLFYVIKWFGLITVPGLLLYFFSLYSPLPSFNLIKGIYEGGIESKLLFSNYFFWLQPEIPYYRYNGPFIEPGDFGCVSAFLIYAAKFDFKQYKYLWIILIGILASLSLAGYVLLFAGFLFVQIVNHKYKIGNIVILLTVSYLIYYVAINFNNGDNVLNNEIISRLQYDEEKGISGNNRNSELTTYYFFKMFEDNNILLFGYNEQTLYLINQNGIGAGAISLIVHKGVIGYLLLIFPYLYYMLKTNYNRRYAISFFVIFLFYMTQRTESLWISFILCYVYGMDINNFSKPKANFY